MSNPFRRKRAEEGGTASGRASLDADEGQRIQMVAEHAFSPVNSTFDLPATETPERIPSPPPPPPPPKEQTGGKDRGDPASNEETGRLSRQTSRTSKTRSQPPLQTSHSSPPPPPPPKTNTRPAPPPPRRRTSLKDSASSSSSPQAQAQAQPSNSTQTSPAPPRPPQPISREEKRNSKEVPKPVDPFGTSSKTDNVDLEDKELDELDELEETPQVDEETFDAAVSRTNDVPEEIEGEPLSSDESSLLTVSDDEENEDFAQEERIERSASASYTSSDIVMTPTRQKPNPFRQTNDAGGDDATDPRRSLEAEGRPKFTGKMSNTPSSETRVRQSMDVDAFKNLMLTGQASSHPQSASAGETLHEVSISRTASLSDKRRSRDSADAVASSDHDEESSKSKPKPPPPKPRAKNRLSQIQTAPITEYSADDDDADQENRQPVLRPGLSPSASSLGVHEATTNNVSPPPQQQQQPRRPASIHRKTPPSPPLTRRQSTHGVNNLLRKKESSPPPPPPRSSAAPAPPPPPPSRRGAATGTPSQTDTPQKPLPSGSTTASTSSPAPPPARRSSKRVNPSAPRPRQESPSNSSTQPPPPPPPPPPGKRRSIPPGSTPKVSEEDPQVGETASKDILDDLSRLQAEVDALRGKYGVTSSSSGGKGAGEDE